MTARIQLMVLTLLPGIAPGTGLAQVGTPAGPVPLEILQARRDALMKSLGGLPAVVAASVLKELPGELPRNPRQSNDFFYLTGLLTPNAWLLLNVPRAGESVLYLETVPNWRRQWAGDALEPGAEARRITGIADVRDAQRIDADLARWVGGGFLLVSFTDPAQEARLRQAVGSSGAELGDATAPIERLRQTKDADELRRMRRAIDLTAEALSEAMRAARPGMFEYELEAIVEFVFRSGGATRPGFPSIVGSGPNSVTLHYDDNTRRTDGDDLVVMDVGAEFGHYTADVTRTIPASGRFTPRQREVYELVLGAQEAALSRIRPGVTVADLSRAARDHMAANSAGLCGRRSCDAYFAHGLSHWLGMDVHDVGSYQVPLQPGMVLTVEPGIYLADEELGVRIEDDVLVTEDGYELLSSGVPRDPDEVEALMGQDPRKIVPARPATGG